MFAAIRRALSRVSNFAADLTTLRLFQFSARLSLMDYRGIRYTLRAGIERGQWSVVIYPQGVETSGVKVLGTREHAELHARRMIKRWLQSQQGEKEP